MIKKSIFQRQQQLLEEVKNSVNEQSWLFEKRMGHRLDLTEINKLRQLKKAVMIGTAEHSNIGDAAITLAEQEILLEYYPEYYQVEFSTYEITEERYQQICAIINHRDIIFMHGGGNMGNKYLIEEELRRRIIEDFPNNKIIVLPQTIYYEKDEEGKKELAKSIDIYKRHKDLTIFARGEQSFEMAKKYFSDNKIGLMPDSVMFLKRDYGFNRSGAIVSMRDDTEGILRESQKKEILGIVEQLCGECRYTNNMTSEDIDRISRASVVYNELKEYASKKIVVTDRLHGMIFATITNTPCIVMPSYNQKITDYYETFLKDSNSIILIDKYDIEKIKKAINALTSIKTVKNPIFSKINFGQIRGFNG